MSEIAVTAGDGLVVESDWFLQHRGNANGQLGKGKATAAVSVTRLLSDGRPDLSFGGAGTVKASFRRSSPPTAMAVRPRGEILLAGRTCCSEHPAPYLVRIRAGGRVDRRFADIPGRRRLRRGHGVFVTAVLLRRGGEIDLAGAVGRQRNAPDRRGFLVRVRADGTPDKRFGRGGLRLPNLPIDTAAIDSRGRAFAAFEGTPEGDVDVFRLTPGGAIDRSFGSREGAPVRGAGGGEGRLIVAYSGAHPLLFHERIFICRMVCPPAPVMARLAG